MNTLPKCCKNNNAAFIFLSKSCIIPNPFICDICNKENDDCRSANNRCVKMEWI
jgi:hypothetical protein